MTSPLAQPSAALAHPTDQHSAIVPWLHHLRKLFPISHAMVVGAGNGSDSWVRFLQESATEAATLIEADETSFQHLQRATGDRPTWSLCHQLIAPARGPATFHRTTVPSENGLLDPHALASLWPRISLREAVELDAITLAEVIDGLPVPTDWLFLDCLPALPILLGAADHLAHVTVIVTRVTTNALGSQPENTAREPVVAALDALGFQFLTFEPTRNPNTGHALFLRNPAAEAKAVKALRTQVGELEAKLGELIPAFESNISNLEKLLSLSIREQTSHSRKLLATSSQLSLLARFLDKDKNKS